MKQLDFLLTCDDAGRGSVKEFNEFVSFLDEYRIKGTFFAVPKPRDNIPLNENKEWTDALKKAISKGHDVQLHGYAHERFECGFPPEFILSLYPKKERESIKKYITDNKRDIEENLKLDKIIKRLSESKELFERTIGYSPICFRSPLLGTHKNLYKALNKTGIRYSTNFVLNNYGWDYISGDKKRKEWKTELLPAPTKAGEGITELPVSCEYSWFLKKRDLGRAFSEMKRDARKIASFKNSFMMPLSHFYAVNKTGAKLYRKFFKWARGNFDFKSWTIKEYIKERLD